MPTLRKRSTVIERASARDRRGPLGRHCRSWSRSASMICSPTEWTGLNAAIGSCGIRAISAPRIARSSAPFGEPRQIDGRRRVLLEQDLAADDAAGRLDDLKDSLHRHALAAPALADDADDLTG